MTIIELTYILLSVISITVYIFFILKQVSYFNDERKKLTHTRCISKYLEDIFYKIFE